MNYDDYLPHIDVEEGMSRVLNNMALYLKLLNKFNPRQMTDLALEAIASGDKAAVIQSVHALRGTSGNLSLPALSTVTEHIEELAKRDMDYSHLVEMLENATDGLEKAIETLTANI
ncbi:MAG: Hpt domain-containing protein [Defluviitaleaceae bacterium]|nr:Hpt domain-containing protein [Defluviitaleaceae bacterium]